jgi:hypothetical protein
MVEVLRCLGDMGFGLHSFFQCADGRIWGDFEREKVAIVVRGGRYGESNTPFANMSVEIAWGLENLYKHVVDNQMVGDLRGRWWGVVGCPRLRKKMW